jgi:hypothetical protein
MRPTRSPQLPPLSGAGVSPASGRQARRLPHFFSRRQSLSARATLPAQPATRAVSQNKQAKKESE